MQQVNTSIIAHLSRIIYLQKSLELFAKYYNYTTIKINNVNVSYKEF